MAGAITIEGNSVAEVCGRKSDMKALPGAFVSFLTGKNVLFQKSLQQAVPDLQRLLTEPVRTLECGDITIGPEGNCLFSILLYARDGVPPLGRECVRELFAVPGC